VYMEVYCIENKVSETVYYGLAKNTKKRMYTHGHCYRVGKKTPLYDAMRKYGIHNFNYYVIASGLTLEEAQEYEIQLIAESKHCGLKVYNLHLGGSIGFDVRLKDKESVKEWKAKMSVSRKGKKPALGMQHTEENKKLFGKCAKLRWDIYGRYPNEVLDYGFTEANKRYGISKTHYYRLRKERALSNEQG
jgi:group I intron endonuclease